MDKKKLEQFRKKLEQRQQDLRRTLSRNVQDGRAADSEDTAQDVADKAANSYTKEFLFSQSSNDRALLARVEEALGRIRDGSFGECINCGNEVNAKRLEAVPWARYCISCQEKIEQGQIQEVRP
jgi:DnaK suppressor protein